MDDDLPKEGELLDISKKRTNSTIQSPTIFPTEKKSTDIPARLIVLFVIAIIVVFVAKKFSGGHVDLQKVAMYRQNTQSVFDTMKSQLPYLVNVKCEGSDPILADCVNFVGTFRPIKGSETYLTSMGIVDKAQGVTDADVEIIKGHIKVLIDIKRTILASREKITFEIDSVTVPKVGEEYNVKIKCIESGADSVQCETIR